MLTMLLWWMTLLGMLATMPGGSAQEVQRDPNALQADDDTGRTLVRANLGSPADGRLPIDVFLDLHNGDYPQRIRSLTKIDQNWNVGDAAMLIEIGRAARDPRTRAAIVRLLSVHTGQNFGPDFDGWQRWIWNREVSLHPNYASFKKAFYADRDPRFQEYFDDAYPTSIRLDEIRWGGVRRDGIPPLKNPETISANQANYLADSDVVFGVEFNGKARAYPKRILAWHEMVKDIVGGRSINGVYCTLCGSMIVYDPQADGKHYELGTSGFLYRSNKLMYDHETKSLWSTLDAQPVVGPLVGKGIKLKPLYVVTTTWGKWKSEHPRTDVLSLRTGHRRNYAEGAAYRDYFATDQLMFAVPKIDGRLKNKDEVLIVRDLDGPAKAIAVEFLNRNRIYCGARGSSQFVVLTDDSGANRVYEADSVRFASWEAPVPGAAGVVVDTAGGRWRVGEEALVRIVQQQDAPNAFKRLSAHRAFWFGWFAAHPDTELVQ